MTAEGQVQYICVTNVSFTFFCTWQFTFSGRTYTVHWYFILKVVKIFAINVHNMFLLHGSSINSRTVCFLFFVDNLVPLNDHKGGVHVSSIRHYFCQDPLY